MDGGNSTFGSDPIIDFGLREFENGVLEDTAPEDVDNTEAGWSTDFAVSLLAILYMITAFTSYSRKTSWNFFWMHTGTMIAHFGGGLAHAFFPNRASDGTGQIGFYVTIFIGYCGNCMRYGLGWGFPSKCWNVIALLNVIWLFVAGLFSIFKMDTTTERIDDAVPAEDGVFLPDTAFGFGELFCAVMEIVASLYYVCRRPINDDARTGAEDLKLNRSGYAITASFMNLVGWVSVYAVGLWSAYSGTEYDTRITQLIFHYAMIVFLWAINEQALLQTQKLKDQESSAKVLISSHSSDGSRSEECDA